MDKLTAQDIKNGDGALVLGENSIGQLMIVGGQLLVEPAQPRPARRTVKLDAQRPKRLPASGIVFASKTDKFIAQHAAREDALSRMERSLMKLDA